MAGPPDDPEDLDAELLPHDSNRMRSVDPDEGKPETAEQAGKEPEPGSGTHRWTEDQRGPEAAAADNAAKPDTETHAWAEAQRAGDADPATDPATGAYSEDAPRPDTGKLRIAPEQSPLHGRKLPKIIGSYRILEFLGAGGMGTVFKAKHVDLDRITALKVITIDESTTDEQAAQFLREARSAAAVEHPHLVTLYGIGRQQDLLYMAMRFIDGGDVSLRMQRDGVMDSKDAIRIFTHCIEALTAIYDARMVHRDIKPGNIFLDNNGNAFLGDLGLAILAGDRNEIADEGAFAGTPAYTSPEQAKGEKVDIRTDIYALGACLYFMLTAEPPYLGSTPFEVLAKAINAPTPDPRMLNRGISNELAAICMRAMAKEPLHRYPDPHQVVDDIRAVAMGQPLVHTRPAPVGHFPEAVGDEATPRRSETDFDRDVRKGRITVVTSTEQQAGGDDDDGGSLTTRLVRRFFGKKRG